MDMVTQQVSTGSRWTKQEPLGEALAAMARELGADARMPTVRALCRTYGVSTSTLDPVLRQLERRGVIRRRHGSGIFVAPTVDTRCIGVVFGGNIFSTHYSPFWTLLLEAVRRETGGRRLRPRVYLDIADEADGFGAHAQLIEDIEAARLDGLLLLAPQHNRDETADWGADGVPIVRFGGDSAGWRVLHNHVPCLRLAARALERSGCRRVALMGHHVWSFRDQLGAELRQVGLADASIADASYETWIQRIAGGGSLEQCAFATMQRLIADRATTPLPDVLFSLDDTMTRGALMAMLDVGLQPDRDIRVVSTVNTGSPVLAPFADKLTCIAYDPAASVRAALDMLTILMDGGTPPHNPVLISPDMARVADHVEAKGGT